MIFSNGTKSSMLMRCGAIAASLFLCFACSQKEDIDPSAPKEEEEDGKDPSVDPEAILFSASLQTQDTKTYSEKSGSIYKICWNLGDEICVYSASNKSGVKYCVKSIDSSDPSKAVFAKAEGEGNVGDGPYWAAYPYGRSSFDGSGLKFDLSCAQTYATGSIPDAQNLNSAYTTGKDLKFKNICGAVKISLCAPSEVAISSLTLSDSQGGLGGYVKVEMGTDGQIKSESAFREAGTSIVLDCAGVSLDATPKDFYVCVPEGAFSKDLKLQVENTEGKVFISTSTDETGGNTIKRSCVLEMANVVCDPFEDKKPGETIEFEATIEDQGGTKTSSTEEGSTLIVNWLTSDKIRVFSSSCANGVEFTVKTIKGGAAIFQSDDAEALGAGPYWAAYPSTGWNFSSGVLTYSNSASQVYAQGSIPDGANASVAYIASETISGASASFKNVFGVIEIPVSYSSDIQLASLAIEDLSGNGLVGESAVTLDTQSATIKSIDFTRSSSVITLSTSETIGTVAKNFFAVVPSGAFANTGDYNIKVKVTAADGKDYFVRSKSSNNLISRSQVRRFGTLTPLRFVCHTSQAEGSVTMSTAQTILHPSEEYSVSTTVGSSVNEVAYTIDEGAYDCSPLPSFSDPQSKTATHTITVPETMSSWGYFRVAATTDCAPQDSNDPYVSYLYCFIGPKNTDTEAGCTLSGNYFGGALCANLLDAYTEKGASVNAGTSFKIYDSTTAGYSLYTQNNLITNGYNSVDLSAEGTLKMDYNGNTYTEPIATFTERAFYIEDTSIGGTFAATVPVFSPDGTTAYFVNSHTTSGSKNTLYAYDLVNACTKWTKDVGYTMMLNQVVMVNPCNGWVYVTVNDYQTQTTVSNYAGGTGSSGNEYYIRAYDASGNQKWQSRLNDGNPYSCAPRRSAITVTSDGKYIFQCTTNGHFRPVNALTGALLGAAAGLNAKSLISLETGGKYYLLISTTASTAMTESTGSEVINSGIYSWDPSSPNALTKVAVPPSRMTSGIYDSGSNGPDAVIVSDAGGGLRHIHWYSMFNNDQSPQYIREFFTCTEGGTPTFKSVNTQSTSASAGATTWGLAAYNGGVFLTTVFDGSYATLQKWDTGLSSMSYNANFGDGNTRLNYSTPVFSRGLNVYVAKSGSSNSAQIYRISSGGTTPRLVAESTVGGAGYAGCYNLVGDKFVLLGNPGLKVRSIRISSTSEESRSGLSQWSGPRGDICGTNNLNTVYPNMFVPASSDNYMYPYASGAEGYSEKEGKW